MRSYPGWPPYTENAYHTIPYYKNHYHTIPYISGFLRPIEQTGDRKKTDLKWWNPSYAKDRMREIKNQISVI